MPTDSQTESFKLRIIGDVKVPQQLVDGIDKLKVKGDGNRRDIVINKTMLKWNHFKHRCIKKEVPTEQSCGESTWDCSGE